MTKFLNTDLDTTLGGSTPSDEKVSSQKAIKTYIDTEDAKRVDKTNSANKVYGTDSTGAQTTISYSNTINASYIVQRDANAQVIVPEVPVADENAASKKYVDTGLALKPDTTSLDDVAFSGDYGDLVNTPTFKTINSEIITGTGNIPLQTQLSGTNGNVVTYTATTGTLSELGFDNTPTQNSNKLVKSGPIWTELNKKVNIVDIKNDLTSADTDKPLSAYQGKVLDEKIALAQQSTHDRGVTLNALTSQGQNYTITAVAINNAGTNYTVGDTLFLTSDMAVDAIINVTAVNNSGAITSISLGQGGAFTTAPTSPSSAFVGGTGNGATFNLTTSQVNNSILADISNPQPNDFATVLADEIHNNLRYVWKYADIDGDGTYEWISGYPVTNIERNFYNDPIQTGEIDTNAVTTVKIANNNVTAEKLSDNSIVARHITDGTIVDDHIASGADIAQSKIHNLTTDLSNKVSRTSTAYQLYGTAAANTETTLTYKTDNTASTIAQRDANSQLNVALTPTANTNATSKKYVNDQDALKVDKVNTAKRVYGTDASGNQTTYDYDSFGKVDDVKVGTTSVVVNKIASLGTMAGEDKDDYVLGNNAITAATKCKITYDTKGLVTAGDDLAESDIPNLHLSKVSDVTATATEVNYLSGVTSNVQTQLNNKVAANTAITGATKCKITYDSKGLVTAGADLAESDIPSLSLSKISDVTATAAEVNVLDGITATTAELNILDGVTATASELNILDGATLTTTELNYVDGVTSSIQTQLDNKVDKTTSKSKLYGTDSSGVQTTYDISTNATANTIAYRAGSGTLTVGTPTSNYHATTKKYVDDGLSDKQETLVSGTNIKTINNTSLLGSGNIDTLPSQTGNSGKFLTTDGTDASWGSLATVATSGSYNDLTNKPSIPDPQVNSDWNATSGVARILNKPTLAAVATSGSYTDLSDKPTINDLTTTAQQNALNSGITSSLVTQIGTNQGDISDINGLIPSAATTSNQLADKAFVNSSINSLAAFYITSTAAGAAFASKAALDAGPYYSDGEARTPTKNDYAIVTSDETHSNACTRYSYTGSQWAFQYVVNDTPFTQAQVDALNSGITSALVSSYSTHVADTTIHVTSTDKSNWNNKVDKTTTNSIVYATDGSGNQTTLAYDYTATNNTIVKRTSTGQVRVNQTPTDDSDATSKKYVDDNMGTKSKVSFVDWSA